MDNQEKKIAIACDHAGFKLKQKIIEYLNEQGYIITDFGTFSDESVDYPDFVHPLAKAISNGEMERGIIICGTGNGVNMTANKYPKIRSALCWDNEIARVARSHNNANVIALPAKFITNDQAIQFLNIFLTTPFDGGRHQRRIEKIPIH